MIAIQSLICSVAFSQHSYIYNAARTILVRPRQTFRLSIPSNLGSGYQWVLVDTSYAKVLSHTSVQNPHRKESTDLEVFTLRPLKKGRTGLVFYNLRPFDANKDTLAAKKIIQKIKIR